MKTIQKSEWRLNKELTDKASGSGVTYISRDWYKDSRKITTETKIIETACLSDYIGAESEH